MNKHLYKKAFSKVDIKEEKIDEIVKKLSLSYVKEKKEKKEYNFMPSILAVSMVATLVIGVVFADPKTGFRYLLKDNQQINNETMITTTETTTTSVILNEIVENSINTSYKNEKNDSTKRTETSKVTEIVTQNTLATDTEKNIKDKNNLKNVEYVQSTLKKETENLYKTTNTSTNNKITEPLITTIPLETKKSVEDVVTEEKYKYTKGAASLFSDMYEKDGIQLNNDELEILNNSSILYDGKSLNNKDNLKVQAVLIDINSVYVYFNLQLDELIETDINEYVFGSLSTKNIVFDGHKVINVKQDKESKVISLQIEIFKTDYMIYDEFENLEFEITNFGYYNSNGDFNKIIEETWSYDIPIVQNNKCLFNLNENTVNIENKEATISKVMLSPFNLGLCISKNNSFLDNNFYKNGFITIKMKNGDVFNGITYENSYYMNDFYFHKLNLKRPINLENVHSLIINETEIVLK